jgi:hypothetical protein
MHCDPKPDYLKKHPEWRLHAVHVIRDARQDQVVVYVRREK